MFYAEVKQNASFSQQNLPASLTRFAVTKMQIFKRLENFKGRAT